MIKIIIVDDDPIARGILEKLITNYFSEKYIIAAICESVDSAVIAIEQFDPKLVFLDIQMPKKNGFELLKEVETLNFEVVFTTSHIDYALNAIKISALDYLIKPINLIDLNEAFKKFENKHNQLDQQKKLLQIFENLDVGSTDFNRIALPTENGFEIIKSSAVLYCEANSNYCRVICLDGRIIILSKTLKHIEQILPLKIFQRIHKSYLVNLNYVSRFNKTNVLEIELTNGEKLPVSIRKKEEFMNAINRKTIV
jgi:two-component system LytT family response regulator